MHMQQEPSAGESCTNRGIKCCGKPCHCQSQRKWLGKSTMLEKTRVQQKSSAGKSLLCRSSALERAARRSRPLHEGRWVCKIIQVSEIHLLQKQLGLRVVVSTVGKCVEVVASWGLGAPQRTSHSGRTSKTKGHWMCPHTCAPSKCC